jgi:hypothetical protein
MASGSWRNEPMPDAFVEAWRRENPDVEVPRLYTDPAGLVAIIGREPYGHGDDDIRWHISVRFGDPGHDGRLPTWGELVRTAHELRPGVVFVIGIPPRSWWMNVHPHVLHLIETRDEPLIQSFRDNAAAMVPS